MKRINFRSHIKACVQTISFAVVLIIIFQLFTSPQSIKADTNNQKPTSYFSDVQQNHPFAETINFLKEKSIIQGYSDKTFKPNFSISRAEFLALVMNSLKKQTAGANCFKDVKNEWFAKYICSAKKLGIISGKSKGFFNPYQNINLAEASAILARAYKLGSTAVKKGDPWYKTAISKLEKSSAIPTTIDYVEKKLSRGESAEMIYRLATNTDDKPTKTYENLVSPYPSIESCEELREKFKAYLYRQNAGYYDDGGEEEEEEEESADMVQSVPFATSLETAGPESAQKTAVPSSSTDYSKTNVQVEGVDEADIIKNDGEFIYMVSGQTVRIIKAFHPSEMKELSKVTFSDKNFRPNEMYNTATKLIIIGSSYHQYTSESNKDSIFPFRRNSEKVKVYIFDMTEKNNLKEVKNIEFDGYSISSRRIGSMLYIVMNYNPPYYSIMPLSNDQNPNIEDILPHYKESTSGTDKLLADCSNIHFLPRYQDLNMLTVAGIDIENPSNQPESEVIMGSGNTIYSSMENLYVAVSRYDYPDFGIFDIWNPPSSEEKTGIFRFSLDQGKIAFKGTGEVKGRILNQFSMDESENTFRIAVTVGDVWNTRNPSKNHLYILDRDNLGTTVGKIEDIAPGEKIYSVRFIGKRAYLVTFKKVDPFFVIDLTDSANPKILGALKIPGYSDYLHPYDENHIIGFGKDTVDPQDLEKANMGRDFDFAWYQGMKIALFDVTDVANPKVLHNEIIGDRGTESELLHNHKALYFDKNRNILAFPVNVAEIPNKEKDSYSGNQYGQTVFQGAYFYKLTLDNGFELLGKITHYDDPEVVKKQGMYWYDSKYTVSRIVSIDEFFYTISLGKIKAIKREPFEVTNSIDMEVEDPYGPMNEVY